LRQWIVEHARGGDPGSMDDTTPILDSGILSSLDVVELVIFIESLRGEEVDVDSIEPEALLNVDSLFETFFKAFGR
jgi:acyl carrier protein